MQPVGGCVHGSGRRRSSIVDRRGRFTRWSRRRLPKSVRPAGEALGGRRLRGIARRCAGIRTRIGPLRKSAEVCVFPGSPRAVPSVGARLLRWACPSRARKSQRRRRSRRHGPPRTRNEEHQDEEGLESTTAGAPRRESRHRPVRRTLSRAFTRCLGPTLSADPVEASRRPLDVAGRCVRSGLRRRDRGALAVRPGTGSGRHRRGAARHPGP